MGGHLCQRAQRYILLKSYAVISMIKIHIFYQSLINVNILYRSTTKVKILHQAILYCPLISRLKTNVVSTAWTSPSCSTSKQRGRHYRHSLAFTPPRERFAPGRISVCAAKTGPSDSCQPHKTTITNLFSTTCLAMSDGRLVAKTGKSSPQCANLVRARGMWANCWEHALGHTHRLYVTQLQSARP